MGAEETGAGKFRAVLLTISKVGRVNEDLMPFVRFRANIEKRDADPEDDVAIFNVHGTSSHFVVFLDLGKTMEMFEEEIVPYNVVISRQDRERIVADLEGKSLLKEALGE